MEESSGNETAIFLHCHPRLGDGFKQPSGLPPFSFPKEGEKAVHGAAGGGIHRDLNLKYVGKGEVLTCQCSSPRNWELLLLK